MNIKNIAVGDFYSLLNKYSDDPANKLGDTAEQLMRSLDNKECIIPVLGMQGMGKSTLINAVLGENILPNDADETTCVPVEVKYGENEYAKVFIKGRSDTPTINTIEELEEYVDNNKNPGNEKKVSHIVLYRKRDILKNGITIVDLPGVGSLTHENEETTMRYIEKLCTAIFVIPTVPTIRKNECAFIKSVWSQFPTVMFVQNNWGESKREVEESVEYNSKLLNKIASEINAEFSNEILVVDAYNALVGGIKNDDSMIKKSNISALVDKMHLFAENWKDQLYNSVTGRLCGCVYSAKLNIKKRMDKLTLDREKYEEKRRCERENYRKKTQEVKTVITEIRDYLDKSEDKIFEFTTEKAKETVGNIRSDIFYLIDSGVTDGENLSEAFQQIQSDKIADFSDDCLNEFAKVQAMIKRKLESIAEILLNEEELRFSNASFEKSERFKGEKIVASVLSLGGTVGGFFAGGAFGTWVGSLAVLGSAAGPIGTIAGVVAGVAISIAGGLLGSIVKNLTKKSRANATKSEISPKIDELEKNIKKTVQKQFSQMKEQVNNQLDKIVSNRKSEEKALFENKDNAPTEYSVEELNADFDTLNKNEEELEKCLMN